MPKHRRAGGSFRYAVTALIVLTAVAGAQSSATAGYQRFSITGLPTTGWWGFRFWSTPPPQRSAFAVEAPALTGLTPNSVTSLTLTVRNPNPFPIKVTELGGTLGSTSRSTCRATPSNLVVLRWQGNVRLPLTVPARSTRNAGEIPLYMPNTVANDCQRTTFTIRFHGSAEKVGSHR